jgi:hypothetical protein
MSSIGVAIHQLQTIKDESQSRSYAIKASIFLIKQQSPTTRIVVDSHRSMAIPSLPCKPRHDIVLPDDTSSPPQHYTTHPPIHCRHVPNQTHPSARFQIKCTTLRTVFPPLSLRMIAISSSSSTAPQHTTSSKPAWAPCSLHQDCETSHERLEAADAELSRLCKKGGYFEVCAFAHRGV